MMPKEAIRVCKVVSKKLALRNIKRRHAGLFSGAGRAAEAYSDWPALSPELAQLLPLLAVPAGQLAPEQGPEQTTACARTSRTIPRLTQALIHRRTQTRIRRSSSSVARGPERYGKFPERQDSDWPCSSPAKQVRSPTISPQLVAPFRPLADPGIQYHCNDQPAKREVPEHQRSSPSLADHHPNSGLKANTKQKHTNKK